LFFLATALLRKKRKVEERAENTHVGGAGGKTVQAQE
jgi:hypothetical protein